MDTNFLVFEQFPDPHPYFLHENAKAFMFDIGATVWQNDVEEFDSQNRFYYTYMLSGVEFSRWMLWESKNFTAKEIYTSVPKEILHSYQYFNMPASSAENDPSNPLNMMKKIAKKEDFVILKLDIDNYKIEHQFVKQLLSNDLLQLCDEFFFEDHIHAGGLMSRWAESRHPNRTLKDTYDLLYKLRSKHLIRAHSWP